jgi:Flp pilus assembly protein TadG
MNRSRQLQRGASTVHWLLALIPLLGFGALAIDLNNVYVSGAELQAAADAGALEGARLLYMPKGQLNVSGYTDEAGNAIPDALTAATAAAVANASRGSAVEVATTERGHWQFMTSFQDGNGIEHGGQFTANATTTPASLVDGDGAFRAFADLNSDTDEINAVRVVVQRRTTPVQSFFGRVLGFNSYQNAASAVAYIGFAGSINPGEIDAPIAICLDKLQDSGGSYSCKVGRYAPSAETNSDPETVEWTDLTQPDGNCPKPGGLSGTVQKMQACFAAGMGGGDGVLNEDKLILGKVLKTTNGTQDTAVGQLYECWKNDPALYSSGSVNLNVGPDKPLSLRIPVINCDGFAPGACNPLVGAVAVRVLWIVDQASKMDTAGNVPMQMTGVEPFDDWDGRAIPDVVERWNSFVEHFKIGANNETRATCGEGVTTANKCEGYRSRTIYFAPDCKGADIGGTGGSNFGIRATVPVLVF